jgi:hypothetical protein
MKLKSDFNKKKQKKSPRSAETCCTPPGVQRRSGRRAEQTLQEEATGRGGVMDAGTVRDVISYDFSTPRRQCRLR